MKNIKILGRKEKEEKLKEKEEESKDLIQIIPFVELNPHHRVDLINTMNAKVREGYVLYKNILYEYFDYDDFLKSKIFEDNYKDNKDFIFSFFRDLMLVSNLTFQEKIDLSRGLQDVNKTNMSYKLTKLDQYDISFLALWEIKLIEMLTEMFITPVDIATTYDPLLVEECKKNVTLGNYLYLKKFGS